MTRLLDLIKGLFGLALIAVLLVGVPALLLVIVGYPLPTRIPSTAVIRAHIEDGNIPDAFLIKTLAVVIWFVWAQLAVATLVELVALVRGRLSGRAPVMPGVQLFAGKLVASTVLVVSAFTPTRSLAAAPIVAPEVVQAPLDDVVAGASPSVDHRTSGLDRADPSASIGADGEAAPASTSEHGFYATKSGDNWWDVAERLLGDGMRWSELRSLNSGRTMLTGEVIDDRTEAVRAGWLLAVPADADPGQLDRGAKVADSWSLVDSLRPETLIYEGPTGAERAGSGPAYQVVEGDNLWDIAGRHLGDPFRWPEIYEASTDLTQTFGRRITDPNLIWPDSILVLPEDAVDVPTADAELVGEVLGPAGTGGKRPTDDPAAETGSAPGELHRLAEQAIELAELNEAGAVGDEADPATIDPVIEVEPVRRPEPAPTDPKGPGGPDGPGGPGDAAPDDTAVPAGALAIAGGGALLATGLLALLSRARRLRLAETGEASIPSPPPLELVDIETVLRDRADRAGVEALVAAVATLGARTAGPDSPVAVPEVVRVGRDRVEAVVLDTGSEPPAPWQDIAVAGAALPANRRALAAGLEQLDEIVGSLAGVGPHRRPSPAPTLVTVGDGLLVNLEAVGLVVLTGRPDSVALLAQAMVHELAAAELGGAADLPVDVVLADRVSHLDPRPGVRSIPSRRLVDELEPWFEEVELRLAASGASGPFGLRLVDGPLGAVRPIVVVVDGAELAEHGPAAELAARALDRRLPLAVVAVGSIGDGGAGAAMTIEVDADRVRLEPHGLAAVALDHDAELILGAEALIDHARRAPIIPRPEITWADAEMDSEIEVDQLGGPAGPLVLRQADPSQVPTEETPEHEIVTERPSEGDGGEITDRSDEEESGLLIRVLGPIEIEGGPDDLSPTQVAILAFLALAGPSSTDQIVAAIAPARPEDRPVIEDELAELGDRLGPLFPHAGDGRHRVRSTITDLGSARRWLAQAAGLHDERARNLLQLALSQVRGRPFADADQRRWQWIEDHRLAIATQATSLLIDAGFDLCDSAYAADDFSLALWACEVASTVDPLNETALTRQVQLLTMLDRVDEAVSAVERWESAFASSVGRPAPHGPRLALDQSAVGSQGRPLSDAGPPGGADGGLGATGSAGPAHTGREASHVG